jgi:DNA-binding LytR/AlgR family response regulator
VDYLLKPFSFERFTKAIYKAINIIKTTHKATFEPQAERKPDLFIKSDGKSYPVLFDDILYCEAMKNYTMVVLKSDQKLMPLIPLSKFETLLLEDGQSFIQVHRSFLVSRKHITAISTNNVTINKYEIPIGVQFRERFFRAIGMKDNG